MKQLSIILFVTLLLSSCSTPEKKSFTDLKEYGFKGKVKSVITKNYIGLERQDNKWVISEERIASKQNVFFNINGNITKIIDYRLLENDSWYDITTEFKYENGLKKTSKKTDLYGKQTEQAEYKWLDDKNYILTAKDINGMKVESVSKLNNDFRSYSGEYKYFKADSLVYSESYSNKLDKKGEIISTHFLNKISAKSYTLLYTDKELDKEGNLIKLAMTYEESGDLKRFIVREFSYYPENNHLKTMAIEPDIATLEMIAKVNESLLNANVVNAPYIFSKEKADLYLTKLQTATGIDRLSVLYSYGIELLKDGKSDQSITVFHQVLNELSYTLMKPEDHDEIFYSAKKQLAIANMRKGEQENCIAYHNDESCIIPISKKAQHILRAGSERSIKILNELLKIKPNDYECQYLLNIAHMTLGQYPVQVPEQFRIPEKYFEGSVNFPKFKDIAMPLGVNVNQNSGGTCIDDFNNDGYLDIIASSWGFDDQVRYFENNKNGGFTDKTNSTGLIGVTGGLNLRHADFNNDGHLDFIILRGAWLQKLGEMPNSLIKNNGDGTFTDVTIASGMYSLHPSQTAVWGDFNLDGWLDIFIANESSPDSPNKCELFVNNTNGTFTNVTEQAGISETGYFKGVASGDLNNDRLPDLYLSNYSGENILYYNVSSTDGTISFKKAGKSAGVSKPERSFPTWIFDYDNDGHQDIFVSGYSTNVETPSHLMIDNIKNNNSNHRPLLYKNNGDGTFKELSLAVGLTEPITTMGCNFGDLNNDGYLDFYLATGDPNFFSIVPNRMYLNNKGDYFEDVTYNGGFGHIQKGHAIGFGDMDMDGDQDIYAVMGGAYEGDVFQNILFENPIGNQNNWINIMLQGNTSNRSAIGARIILTLEEDNGQIRKVYHSVGTGASFGGNSLMAEIGVGQSNSIKKMEINWPNKMKKNSIFYNIKVNQLIRIKESSEALELMDLKSIPFKKNMHNSH